MKFLNAFAVAVVVLFGAEQGFAQCPGSLWATSDQSRVWARDNSILTVSLPSSLSHCASDFYSAMMAWQASSANDVFGQQFAFTNDPSTASIRVQHQNPSSGAAALFSMNKYSDGSGVYGGRIDIHSTTTSCAAAARSFSHELGHGFGLSECSYCSNTVMRGATWANGAYNDTSGPIGPTVCDQETVTAAWSDGEYNLEFDPTILDVNGDGVALTSAADGVRFDMNGDGEPEQVAWTVAGGDDGWLVLDRDGNGRIDSGVELFGDSTPQALSLTPCGYNALAGLDDDGDGVITTADAVWAALRVWQDGDHDGVTTPAELSSLGALGITGLELSYRESRRHDQHGNYFRYRAKVRQIGNSTGKWSYDVFLRAE